MIARVPEGQPVVCLSAALARVGNDRQILTDIATFFLEDTPTLLDEIRSGIDDQDSELAARRAHTMKGLAANFDALPCVAAAQDVEHQFLHQNWNAARDGYGHLVAEVERVLAALKAELSL